MAAGKAATPIIWICSKINGLKGCLESVLPRLKFVDISENELEYFHSDNEVGRKPKIDVEVLITDNPYIGPLIYNRNLPFKFIQGTWAGIDPILKWLDDTKPIPSIPICRFAHPTFSQLITEYVVAHVINSERGFGRKMLDAQMKQEWLVDQTPITDHRGLNELKIGILGVGQMGQCIAKTFKFFGSETYGLVRSSSSIKALQKSRMIDQFCLMEEAYGKSENISGLEKLLTDCDYVCNVLPKTPQTNDILGNGKLELCKGKEYGTVLINIGRSNVIKECELLEAIEKNWIREAILDVFDTEPLPPNHPFWKNEKITITPHCAALSRPKDIAQCFKTNYELFENNKPFISCVNWNEKY